MARFTYNGVQQTIALKVSASKNNDGTETSKFVDFTLMNGASVDLPESNPIVVSMIDAGLLTQSASPATVDTSSVKSKSDQAASAATNEKGTK